MTDSIDDLPAADTAADVLFEGTWSAWRTWLVVVALAMLFGLIEAAQLRLGSSVVGQGIPISRALAQVMPYWLLAACVMPMLVALGRRFRVWQFLLRPNVPTLVAMATAFAVLALVGRALIPSVDPRAAGMVRQTPLQLFQNYFPLDLLTYTAFVGTLYAFHYYRETRRREITASRLEASLAEARLGGLEARVDPEFLFKTLNDISTLASQGRQKPVIEMLGRLSEVLRAALSDERPDEIPLKQEIDLLDSYLRVSEPGVTRGSSVQVDVSPDVLGALVPRMILPTIAERFVRQLGGQSDAAGAVTIRATRRDETLQVEIVAAAGDIRRQGESAEQEMRLDGVRERLEQLYGRTQSIEHSTDDAGISAVMTIPFRYALAGEEHTSV